MILKPETIDSLGPDRYKSIMERSKHKEDITTADLEVTKEEIQEAYKQLDPKVVDCLKKAAENIIKFHEAQKEREMWSIEVSEGILAGRVTRAIATGAITARACRGC